MESGFCSIIHDDTLIEKTIINIFIRYFHIFGNGDTIYIFFHIASMDLDFSFLIAHCYKLPLLRKTTEQV